MFVELDRDLGFTFSHLLPTPGLYEKQPPSRMFVETSGAPAHLAKVLFWWKLLMFPLSVLRVLNYSS